MQYVTKLFYRRALVVCFFLVITGSLHAQTPFSKGVNLTGWFQASSAQQIQFSKFTKKDFERIKSLGCDVIRLPIDLHAMTSGEPDYTLDPLFLNFLDQAVTWSEELEINLILDNHTFDPASNTDPNIGSVLVKVWTQMADHYKDRSEYVYYEVLNEPHGIADATWGSIQQTVIDAIRTVDDTHYIVVGPANWNNYYNLANLPVYTDDKLIYTFHFYDPFIFTHQGASWTDPSLVPLTGVPFPYRSADMPATPNALKGTWVESNINNYATEGTVAKVKSLIDVAANFKAVRNVPLFCGEFGVFIPNSDNDDRVAWYQLVRQYLEQKDIPWTIWDYTGGFGLFEKNSNELFDYDLNVPLLEALAMNVPPQKEYDDKPQTTGFLIYDDFIGEGIFDASNPGAGTLNYYAETTPQAGTYCAHWTGVAQYSAIGLDFKPNLDLSLLESHEHVLEFQVRGNTGASSFDIRFVDTKKNDSDHPWRMGKTIDNTVATWDGEWHKVTLPLHALEEKGSYDNGWFPPEDKFDWEEVDRLEIVAEQQALNGIDFWFDDIRVSGEEVPYEEPVTSVESEMNPLRFSVSPNPMRDHLTVQFSLTKTEPVDLTLYSLTGQRISTLASKTAEAGDHVWQWRAEQLSDSVKPGSMYLVELRTHNHVIVKKLMKGF